MVRPQMCAVVMVATALRQCVEKKVNMKRIYEKTKKRRQKMGRASQCQGGDRAHPRAGHKCRPAATLLIFGIVVCIIHSL